MSSILRLPNVLIFLYFCILPSNAHEAQPYNDTCATEIAEFGDSSSEKKIAKSRHALLLCLAENSYLNSELATPIDRTNPGMHHYKIYPAQVGVSIGDDTVTANDRKVRVETIHAQPSKFKNLCCCHTQLIQSRGAGDPVSPKKHRPIGFDLLVDLNAVQHAPQVEITQLKEFFDRLANGLNRAPHSNNNFVDEIIKSYAEPSVDWSAFQQSTGYQGEIHWGESTMIDTLTGADRLFRHAQPKVENSTEYRYQHSLPAKEQTQVFGTDSCDCGTKAVPIKRALGDEVPFSKYEPTAAWFVFNSGNLYENNFKQDGGGHFQYPSFSPTD